MLSTIFDEWNSDGPYSHGFLGIIVVAYVFYLKRHHLQITPLSKRHYTLALVCLVSSLSVSLIALLSSIQQLQQLAFFSILVSLLFCFYGWRVIRAFFIPLLMLLLILPVWNMLQLPLRELSTQAGQWGPELLGIAVDRDHYRLSTAGGMFDVDPACSGLGFFMVAALLTFCVSFFNKLSVKRTLTFLMISLAISIIANWLRVMIIIIVGTYTEMNHFIVHDHLTFGWVVFAICLVPLIYIARTYFEERPQKEQQENPKKLTTNNVISNKLQVLLTYSIVIAFIVASYWIPSRYDKNYTFVEPSLNTYQVVSTDKSFSPSWKPYSQGATKERFSYYVKGSLGFQVYLADYIKQEQASEMIYVENYLFDEDFWEELSNKKLALSTHSHLQKVNLVVLKKSAHRYRLVASWYVINGVITSDKKIAKLAEVKAALVGQPGATLVAVSVDFDGEEQATVEHQLSEFIETYLNPNKS